MKKAILAIALLLCTTCLPAQSLRDLSFGTDSTLEVLTWNVENFPKNGLWTVDSLALAIRSLDPDLIAFQEIFNPGYFTGALLPALPGYAGAYVDNVSSGLAYIYKTSTVTLDSVYEIYTTASREFPRPPLVLEMHNANTAYTFFNNHLKCCGNGVLDTTDLWDEENRRYDAMNRLKGHLDNNYQGQNAIVLGDLNDQLTDNAADNVFQGFLSDTADYRFADMSVATGTNANWSFPNFPSHIDHLLILQGLFDEWAGPGMEVQTIRVDDYLQGGFSQYDQLISDHRPVGLKLVPDIWLLRKEGRGTAMELRNYPNPFVEKTVLERTEAMDAAWVTIYDSKGCVFRRLRLAPGQKTVQWDARQLPLGFYLAVLETEGEMPAVTRMSLQGP